MKKLCIIGLGNMGKAISDILCEKNLFELSACEHSDDINEKLLGCDIFVIAVKPQNFEEMAENIKIDLSNKLGISIMAGVSIARMQDLLGTKKIVRTLPNLALKLGESLTIWKASAEVEAEGLAEVRALLKALGDELELKDERDIVNFGALCGCGPAYFAYLGEKMALMAKKFGLSEEEANKLADKTLIGTSELIKESGWSLTELRKRVSSKGGVTEAAINKFEEGGFEEVFEKGIEAAIKRTDELNS